MQVYITGYKQGAESMWEDGFEVGTGGDAVFDHFVILHCVESDLLAV